MKKKVLIIIVVIGALLIGYGVFRIFYGPFVGFREKREVREFVETYLTNKYGEHDFKATSVKYEYDMRKLFDYSNPIGYWVDFKSDVVPDCWVTINGLKPNDYRVETDLLVEFYHFPNERYFDIHKKLEKIQPLDEIEATYLKMLQEEFDSSIYEVGCDIIMDVPDDYGKIPTLEELENNTNLYRVQTFRYKVPYPIKDKDEYEERLKEYVINKFNRSAKIYFGLDNTLVDVFLNVNQITNND